MFCLFFFFFSSRRRHTRLQGDWSSDVCSSDLEDAHGPPRLRLHQADRPARWNDSSRPLRRRPGGTREGEEFVGTGIDVTEQEHLTAALRKSEVELRQILDLAPQIIGVLGPRRERLYANRVALDRKSTRLNSSHLVISYAVFCLKKKKKRI